MTARLIDRDHYWAAVDALCDALGLDPNEIGAIHIEGFSTEAFTADGSIHVAPRMGAPA